LIHLHIGLPKTGTTSLQAFLRLNRQRLARQGIEYPETCQSGAGNATPAALVLLGGLPDYFLQANPEFGDKRDFESLWLDVAGSARGPESSILASSEEIAEIDPAEFDRRTRFDGQRKRIIVFLRRQDEMLESMYLQMVRAGLCDRSFETFLGDYLGKDGGRDNILRYHDMLERWCSAFGRENVKVLLYENGPQGSRLYERFLEVIGVRWTAGFEVPPRLNDALHPLAAEYLRQLNKAGTSTRDRRSTVLLAARQLGLQAKKVRLLSPSRRAEVMELFAAQNRRVAQDFFPQAGWTLFDEQGPATPHVDLHICSAEYQALVDRVSMLERRRDRRSKRDPMAS
jgi:hypothetical protein